MRLSLDDLPDELGSTDIYLLDQLMKRRIVRGMRILDAGCGTARNVAYLLGCGLDVCGVDANAEAIAAARRLAARLQPGLPAANFRHEPVERLSFADAEFDVVIAIAVLHFAADPAHFDAMLDELWRVLKPGGMLFTRLASSIGLETQITPLGQGRFHLPDGTDRFLVDAAMVAAEERRLDARRLEPLKTVNVAGERCMTTWVVAKAAL